MHHGYASLPRLAAGDGNAFSRSLRWLFILSLLLGTALLSREASAQAWSLTTAQRQAYLQYYAPIIFHRADEDGGKLGRDWITNYDFDRDGNFANNRVNWLNTPQYIAASASGGPSAYDRWRIRPTLYTTLIEYMNGGSKSLVLLYQIYHASDKNGSFIHDWERIEIALNGVTGTPGGAGELVSYATVTAHTEHIVRQAGDPDLNFMQTATGKHLMIWQADENGGWPNAREHELHFVENPYSWIAGQVAAATGAAKIDVTDEGDKKNVHYVYVPESSSAAVSAWNATPITYANAASRASGRDDSSTPQWLAVPRITYELQDIADIHVTQWQNSAWQTSWTSDVVVDILLESPITNEAGAVEVPAGMQRFYVGSRDSSVSSQTDGREGYLQKKWLWGNYSAEFDSDIDYDTDDFGGFEGLGRDSAGLNRGDASGQYSSLSVYWWQHDYFAHSGVVDTRDHDEAGRWLVGNWYKPENGGFDGRWAQLFDDRITNETAVPLTVFMPASTISCGESVIVTAQISGGVPPYALNWSNVLWQSADGRSAEVASGKTGTLVAQSADGQSVIRTHRNVINCRPGREEDFR